MFLSLMSSRLILHEMCCMNKIAFGVTIKIHLSDLEETLENEQIKS